MYSVQGVQELKKLVGIAAMDQKVTGVLEDSLRAYYQHMADKLDNKNITGFSNEVTQYIYDV